MENTIKSPPIFSCEPCNYECKNKKDYNKHLLTNKHCKQHSEKVTSGYVCDTCSKSYRFHSGLWKHNKTCCTKIDNSICIDIKPGRVNTNECMSIIRKLLTDNTELRNFIIEQSKTLVEQASEHKKETTEIVNKVLSISSQPVNVIQNNTNSNNKFNINVFLNEDCKNAMNFEDFLNGIEVTQEDIQNNGKLGFVNGISKIIMDNLNMLSVHQRPIHCTDWKREVMYIKDDNKWTREIDDKKMEDAIQVVSQKSIRTLHAWKMSNPDYKNSYSAFALECIDMQLHSVAGYHREVYYPKVAKLIARHVLLERKNGTNV